MTFEEAIANAVRLLQSAEGETNLAVMEGLERLAAAWLAMASLIGEHERA